MKTYLLLAAVMIILTSACSPPSAWKRCDRLLGAWHDETTDSTFHFVEVWTAANDSVISGRGCGLVKSDTAFKEQLKLIRRGSKVIYAARVPDQNEGRWVEFTSRASNGDSLIFENRSHDFPQRIAYAPEGSGWHVILTGAEQGEAIEQHLHYTRRSEAAGS